jgi:choline dehydrogenase-like flavoprotein
MSCDAIIVGSGATGSWAAKLLTERGMTVLLLEAGPCVTDARSESAGLDDRQPIQSRCYAFSAATRHLFVDDVDNPYEMHPEIPFLWIRSRQVGGRMAVWHRVALRMSDRQFKAASLDRFGSDWPLTYSELRPHYDTADRFLAVSGLAANLEELPDGPFRPATLSGIAIDIKHSVEHEWPDRHVTALRRASEPLPETPGDSRCSPCSAGVALAAAESTSRLTLRSHSVVSRVICDRTGGRALGVEYVDCRSGASHEAYGAVVILCASTIETTRIMLNSTSARHPDGIGNSNGLLGCYLTEHTCGVGATGLRVGECQGPSEFYIPNFCSHSRPADFLRGYGIQGYIKPGPDNTQQCTLVCFGEMLPRITNTVTLGRAKDRWGIPVARVRCHFSDNELEMAQDQAARAAEILQCAGFELSERNGLNPLGCSIHEVGTARMGADPRTSILNHRNQCWGVPNLFVTDGAAFPSVGFQNPTLTMMALTGRACDYIAGEFSCGHW